MTQQLALMNQLSFQRLHSLFVPAPSIAHSFEHPSRGPLGTPAAMRPHPRSAGGSSSSSPGSDLSLGLPPDLDESGGLPRGSAGGGPPKKSWVRSESSYDDDKDRLSRRLWT